MKRMKQNDVTVSHSDLNPNSQLDFKFPHEIVLYDSTLRDGEQMPGVSFTSEQKLSIARKLDEIGIKEIEAGFPAVSQSELKAVRNIVREDLDANILVLSRLKKEDIDAAVSSGADVILLFIASSDLHLKYKLHLSQQQVKEKMVECVQYAKDHGVITSFSTEDSTRSSLSFLEELVRSAGELGVDRIGFTDTVGCAPPYYIRHLYTHMRKIVSIPFSAHLHNDFGLALVNTLTALTAGAQYCCVTVNGWGERAGNVPLEQLVMTLKILYHKDIGVDTTQLYSLSKMVSEFTDIPISKTQPFVGDNAFAHESGIHVAAMLENTRTYEAISPRLVGNRRKLLLGKHSGKHFIVRKLRDLNIHPDRELLDDIVSNIKQVGEEKGLVTDQELVRIVEMIQGVQKV